MSQPAVPDEDESAVRETLRRFGVRPAGYADDGEQPPAPVVVPPKPDYAPTVTAPAPRGAGAPRLPHWWDDRKPELPTGDQPAVAASSDDEGEHDEPGEKPDEPEAADDDQDDEQPTGRPRLQVVKRDHADDPDDQGEDGGEEPADDDEDAGEGPAKRSVRRWRPAGGGSARPPFATPAFPSATDTAKERKSLVQAAREASPEAKWLISHASGLATGFVFGIPQFAHDVTRSVAESPFALRDNPDAYFWAVGAVLVLSLDRATRNWWLLVAWATRGLTTSVVIGALLHGNPIPH
ncbi:hypothetical protein [Streptomyces europaeiscabiei]|uniref:hypothetical protein n=1 Tax=Streptomyces europaeiscabiei TaxID=146819 RepID=UPI002E13E9AA|nr:hypothetical protein OHB30_33065 [Streptomyces europaeiscabiei]